MRLKSNYLFFIVILFSLCFLRVVSVQAQDVAILEEYIENFSSSVFVNTDNSIEVIETIVYNGGKEEHHGIYRDIYPYSSIGSKMNIKDISVVDEKEAPYIFSTSSFGSNFRIKIGDPDSTFTGQKIYVIKYNATKAVAQFKDFDEIYWNATGNEWDMPIHGASVSVILPTGVNAIQTSCYLGAKGSKEQCSLSDKDETYTFSSSRPLAIGEGLTVAVGFPKGIVYPYSKSDKVDNFFDVYLSWIIIFMLPILTLIFSLWYWYKKGKDPKGTGVIVPQYDVPDDLSPIEVGAIVNEKIKTDYISAEIIYLATKGYLKINQIQEKVLGIFNTTDYELIKLKNSSDLKKEFDRKILEHLFVDNSDTVKLSALKGSFYKKVKIIIDSVGENLLTNGYYKNLGKMKNSFTRILILSFTAVWASSLFGGLFGALFFKGNSFPLILSIFISIVIYGIVSHFNPAKTEKGVALKEHILGLEDYLRIAEKDRLLFHNAPEKKPEIFEKLLPYAMVLGVAKIWAKEFEGIYSTPPSWYSEANNTGFNVVVFTNSLSNFSSYATSSMISSPSGSGSGGGGFSGGGGGGGGGGSW